jgi:Big-like domain-containing protein/fibronectin type III domain protein/calcineurin-like phosphoesterase family protein
VSKDISALARRGRFGGAAAVAVCLAAAAMVTGVTRPPQAAASATCATSTPPSGTYTITLCITAPAAGATVTGSTMVTSAVSFTGTSPGVQELVFTLGTAKLLYDFQAPYQWSLDSTRWVDGTYTLHVFAIMRDGFHTAQTSENLTFSNGITTPPVNNATFTPTSGTTPAQGQPLVVGAVGDGASGETAEGNVANLIASWNPNLFLYLGDVYENGRPMEFSNWYGSPGTPGTYGRFYSITDPAVGNHEYVGSDLSGYEWYWNNVPHYYSFDAGGWHFVALDDVSKFIGSDTSNANYQAETTWLKNDLANNNLGCTIVYYHEPEFNVGPEGTATNAAGIWQILAQNHVTLVLNGHDHDYQRWVPLDGSGAPDPNGVTEFVAGSGGHGHQARQTTDSRLAASDFTHFGALRLALGSSGAEYQFVTTAGTTIDSGSIPCQGGPPDTTPPSQPQNLTATALSQGQVQLSWDASTDNVGVTAYDIYRDGTLLTSSAPPAGYLDQSVRPATTYSYYVVARDAAGNTSAPSDPASVTTPAQAAMFSDGFETGDMSKWTTSTGIGVQSTLVNDGNFAAEAVSTGSASYAYKQLAQTWPALYYSTRFYVANRGSSSVYLLRFRTATKAAIAALYVSSTGKLGMRNDTTGVSTTSTASVSSGAWHTLEFYASPNGTSGQTSVWLDGTPVAALTMTQSLGTAPIGYLQLGDTSTGKTFDVAFDDVQADPMFLAP